MAEEWAGLTPDAKLEKMLDSWRHPAGIEFVSDRAAATDYAERVTRLIDAVHLKTPDRVPVIPSPGNFAAHYTGMTIKDAMYDVDQACRAYEKYTVDFAPDAHAGGVAPGRVYDIIDYRLYVWPGHGTGEDSPFQCVEAEYMKAEEYDLLINNPADYWLRYYLPRVIGILEPFRELSALPDFAEKISLNDFIMQYGRPEVRAALEVLGQAREEAVRWHEVAGASNKKMLAAGFPLLTAGGCKAPFDLLGDTLRGTRGMMLDLFRRPEKIIEAVERLTPLMIDIGVNAARATGRPLVFMPLHKGADGFLSDAQFKTFYWPTLQKVMLGLIEEGLTPFPFAEGSFNTRLEVISDMPRGKVVWRFDDTDMARAKEVLGDNACIMGNVPASLTDTGTPDDIRAYCQNLIDVAGKGGGFILSTGSSMDMARPENVRAMIDFTKEYGVYR